MRAHHGSLRLLVLMVVALVGAVAVPLVVVPWFWPRLPDPAVADREGLLRWMVARDLNAEPAETRGTLARRLEEEFGSEVDWEAVAEELDESQRRRLWENIVVLLEPWFMDKVDRYFNLAVADRCAYVDRLIDKLVVWQGAESLRPRSAGHGDGQGGLLEALCAQIERCKQRARPARRKQISQFLMVVQTRWCTRKLQQLISVPD